jgi:predicted ATPase
MSEQKAFLEKVRIKNLLSLRDVTLPFKPLTILAGPNASGKSNILNALYHLNRMILEEPSSYELSEDSLWGREENHIIFQLNTEIEGASSVYELELKPEVDNPVVSEELSVKGISVISILRGQGFVLLDEDRDEQTKYESDKLALKSAGDYGNKPITNTLREFIKGWQFYDFQPEIIRGRLASSLPVPRELRESPKLDSYGLRLSEVLTDWYQNTRDNFNSVSESLATCTNLRIAQHLINGDDQLCLLEGYKNPIPLKGASNGTLRLVAYYTLLNQPDLPPLIAIEEPERNLHPGALTDIANVLEQIAEHSQVIITTHSSQLLDAFKPEDLSDSLGVLLLNNPPGQGTEVLNLEEIRDKREALDGWIADFGIGSAIFHSELLQDLMEEPI